MMSRLLWISLLAVLGLTLTACDTLGYYGQAATGQISLLMQRQSVERLLADHTLPDADRDRLTTVLRAREFAEQHLGLQAGGSYLSYVDLEREHVLWNVFAAPEFSTQPLTWCFPIAGCVSYRGYFAERRARAYAERLAGQGLDVYVGGVDAYSTLGWFDDPLFSTLMNRPAHRLVALVFHELAHRMAYLPGDTTFNESYASFVEREGVRRWLLDEDDEHLYRQFLQEQQRQAEFVALVTGYRDRFDVLYGSGLPVDEMRQVKSELQDALRQGHRELTRQWGVNAYQRWFQGPLNNAQLATVASYNDLVPAFAALFEERGGDWREFHEAVRAMTELSVDERGTRLAELQRLSRY